MFFIKSHVNKEKNQKPPEIYNSSLKVQISVKKKFQLLVQVSKKLSLKLQFLALKFQLSLQLPIKINQLPWQVSPKSSQNFSQKNMLFIKSHVNKEK